MRSSATRARIFSVRGIHVQVHGISSYVRDCGKLLYIQGERLGAMSYLVRVQRRRNRKYELLGEREEMYHAVMLMAKAMATRQFKRGDVMVSTPPLEGNVIFKMVQKP